MIVKRTHVVNCEINTLLKTKQKQQKETNLFCFPPLAKTVQPPAGPLPFLKAAKTAKPF